MNSLRYITGKPITLENIGIIYPLTLDEYIENDNLFTSLNLTINNLLQTIDTKEKEKRADIVKNVKNFDILSSQKDYLLSFLKLLTLSFKTDRVFYLPERHLILIQNYSVDENGEIIIENEGIIDRNNYDYLRNNLIKINYIRLPKQANNAKLQEWFDLSEKNKASKNKNAGDMEDIIVSIMAFNSYTPEQILKLTMYQINKIIQRLNKISEYETSVQFLCVGAEKIKLEHWSSHIEDKDDENSVSYSEFTGGIEKTIKNK